MQEITKEDTLKTYQKKMAHNRKVSSQVKAVMQRAKKAGIPKKFMRINEKSFSELLDPSYHGNVDIVASKFYQHPKEIIKKEFVVIDGGGIVERKMAGFALLFRMIACDRQGFYKNGGELAHQLQSIKVFDGGMGRNDLAETMRDVDILFLSEFAHGDFRNNFETGRFMDEILNHRDDHSKTTIVSFTDPLPSGIGAIGSENAMNDTERFGQYMCSLSKAFKTEDRRFVKIRVKTNE